MVHAPRIAALVVGCCQRKHRHQRTSHAQQRVPPCFWLSRPPAELAGVVWRWLHSPGAPTARARAHPTHAPRPAPSLTLAMHALHALLLMRGLATQACHAHMCGRVGDGVPGPPESAGSCHVIHQHPAHMHTLQEHASHQRVCLRMAAPRVVAADAPSPPARLPLISSCCLSHHACISRGSLRARVLSFTPHKSQLCMCAAVCMRVGAACRGPNAPHHMACVCTNTAAAVYLAVCDTARYLWLCGGCGATCGCHVPRACVAACVGAAREALTRDVKKLAWVAAAASCMCNGPPTWSLQYS